MPKQNKPKTKKTVKKPADTIRWPRQKRLLAAGTALVLCGLAILAVQAFNLWFSQRSSAAPQPISNILISSKETGNKPYIAGEPANISIPSVNINLKVTRGYHNTANNTWTLSTDKAHWAVMTKQANDKSGATFIYGHYRPGVFLNLPKIKPGELAKVKTDKGNIFTYKFNASSVVSPSDDAVFHYRGKPVLILQTCTGIRFENRQLFVFDLVRIE